MKKKLTGIENLITIDLQWAEEKGARHNSIDIDEGTTLIQLYLFLKDQFDNMSSLVLLRSNNNKNILSGDHEEVENGSEFEIKLDNK